MILMQLSGAPMSDPRDEIARIIAEAEKAAYLRGWNEAVAAMSAAAEHFRTPDIVAGVADARPAPERNSSRGRPSSNAMRVVEDTITAMPGMAGVEVVRAAQRIDPSLKERTVRTCLRRLRLSKVIWQRSGLWYPKAKEKTVAENVNGEAVGSPPH